MNILFGLQRKINLFNLTQKSQFKDPSRLGITEFYDFKRNPIWVGHCIFEETKGQKPGATFLMMLIWIKKNLVLILIINIPCFRYRSTLQRPDQLTPHIQVCEANEHKHLIIVMIVTIYWVSFMCYQMCCIIYNSNNLCFSTY